MKVLLIEPDRVMGRTLAEAFKDAGHDVDVRRDAQTGLDGLDEHQPDVVVLETQLGKHNGVEFLYELRSQTDWLDVPVIIHTANSHALEPEFASAWRQLGVSQILYKPQTSMARLKKTIATVLA